MEGLKREDIIRVIEGKGAAERVPLLMDIWIYDNVFENDPNIFLAAGCIVCLSGYVHFGEWKMH